MRDKLRVFNGSGFSCVCLLILRGGLLTFSPRRHGWLSLSHACLMGNARIALLNPLDSEADYTGLWGGYDWFTTWKSVAPAYAGSELSVCGKLPLTNGAGAPLAHPWHVFCLTSPCDAVMFLTHDSASVAIGLWRGADGKAIGTGHAARGRRETTQKHKSCRKAT